MTAIFDYIRALHAEWRRRAALRALAGLDPWILQDALGLTPAQAAHLAAARRPALRPCRRAHACAGAAPAPAQTPW